MDKTHHHSKSETIKKPIYTHHVGISFLHMLTRTIQLLFFDSM